MNRSNPAKHSLANRFRLRPQEFLIGTPINRNLPKPSPFNHLIFSNRYKKPPSPRVLTYKLPFAFPSPAKAPTRRGSVSRSEVQRGICFLPLPSDGDGSPEAGRCEGFVAIGRGLPSRARPQRRTSRGASGRTTRPAAVLFQLLRIQW